MVLINKNSKCRVWINENITLNFPSKKAKLNEQEFLFNIVRLFEDKCIKSVLASEFFTNVRKNIKVFEALHFIEIFIRTHKIVLPNKLNSIT